MARVGPQRHCRGGDPEQYVQSFTSVTVQTKCKVSMNFVTAQITDSFNTRSCFVKVSFKLFCNFSLVTEVTRLHLSLSQTLSREQKRMEQLLR